MFINIVVAIFVDVYVVIFDNGDEDDALDILSHAYSGDVYVDVIININEYVSVYNNVDGEGAVSSIVTLSIDVFINVAIDVNVVVAIDVSVNIFTNGNKNASLDILSLLRVRETSMRTSLTT